VLKEIFKSAALQASHREEVRQYMEAQLDRGLRLELVRVNVARKLATIVLTLWKKGEEYDPERFLTTKAD